MNLIRLELVELCFDDIERAVGVALFELFADAMDEGEAAGVDGHCFSRDEVGRFEKNMAAFAVARKTEFHAEVLEHRQRDLARERAILLKVSILSAEQYRRIRNRAPE